MTTDNRTNEPTEAQILAALNAYSSKGLEIDGYNPSPEYQSLEEWGERFADQMRAALVAAASVAPQAESVGCNLCGESIPDAEPHICFADDSVQPSSTVNDAFNKWHEGWWRNEPNPVAESNAREAFYAGWDGRGAPGMMDEGKIAEVIASVANLWDDPLDDVHDIPQIARAVVAALGGENR